MPPIRMPNKLATRTERTHEENQERAYIAASRRSDRSLEARVESARRASEIHKKRTGRSLRVREEDVMNEEMYEEEDDDLPMQFRRIAALNPNYLNGRLGQYLAGQAGMRSVLANAIFSVNNHNQSLQMQQNQVFNPVMDQNGLQQPNMMQAHAFSGMPQSPYPMQTMQNNMQNMQLNMHNNMQSMRPVSHHRAASIATPEERLAYQQAQAGNMKPSTPMNMDARRMSVPPLATSPGVPSPAASHPQSSSSSHPPTPHPVGQSPQQVPTPYSGSGQDQTPQSYRASASIPPAPGYDANLEAQIFPFTTKVPLAQQQLMGSNATHPSQLSPGLPTPSMGAYSYNPNGKPKRSSSNEHNERSCYFNGLDQTLSQANPYSCQSFFTTEPQSAVSAPAVFDKDFESMMGGDDFSNYDAPGFDFSNNDLFKSGEITPVSNVEVDTSEDFFNFGAAVE